MRPARRLLFAFTLAIAAGVFLVAQRGVTPDQAAQRLAAERAWLGRILSPFYV